MQTPVGAHTDTPPTNTDTPPPPTNTCPTHWGRVPELPKCWQDAPLQDEDGFGRLYRLQVRGVWYLLKFLPPFDGRVSITDANGKVRVLAGVAEALALLDALATKPEAV